MSRVFGANMKNHRSSLLKLVIGLGLLAFLYTKLPDREQLWQQISTANFGLLLLGACCYALAVALSGIKWGILLASVGLRPPTPRLLGHQWLAEFFNNFLPGQVGGDVMRGYALAADTHQNAAAAASVLIDRFIGLMVFMSAASVASIIMLLWGRRPDGTPFAAAELLYIRLIAVGVVGLTLLLAAIVGAVLSRRIKQLVERVLQHMPFAQHTTPIWRSLAAAFNAYRHQYRAMWLTALCGLLIVFFTSVNIWLIAQAVQPGSISLLAVLAINPLIVFVSLVPISPGGLGVRQTGFAGLFALIGADWGLGFAVGLIQQFIGYLVSLPGGYLWIRNRRRDDAKIQTNSASADDAPYTAPIAHQK